MFYLWVKMEHNFFFIGRHFVLKPVIRLTLLCCLNDENTGLSIDWSSGNWEQHRINVVKMMRITKSMICGIFSGIQQNIFKISKLEVSVLWYVETSSSYCDKMWFVALYLLLFLSFLAWGYEVFCTIFVPLFLCSINFNWFFRSLSLA